MTFTTRDRNNSEQIQFRARNSRSFRFASMDWLEKPFVPHLLAAGQCPDGTSCNKVSEKLSRPEAMKQNWRRSWDEVTAEETSLTNSNLIPRAGAPRLMHEARQAPLFSSCRVLVLKPSPSFPCGIRRTLILALCKSNSSLENSNFFPLSCRRALPASRGFNTDAGDEGKTLLDRARSARGNAEDREGCRRNDGR